MTLFLAAAQGGGTIGSSGTLHYLLIMALMMTGIYLILSRSNMIKSIIGLNLFQVAVIMFYVSMGKVEQGTAPILIGEDVPHVEDHHDEHKGEATPAHAPTPSTKEAHPKKEKTYPTRSKVSNVVYSNPLPHVLMLTAIVVGVATTALALSLVVRINEAFGTIEEDELEESGALS